MVEDPIDRSGGSLATIQGRELAAWEKLSFKLRVLDVWHEGNFFKLLNSLNFSCSNKGIGSYSAELYNAGGIASRDSIANSSGIDRFYK